MIPRAVRQDVSGIKRRRLSASARAYVGILAVMLALWGALASITGSFVTPQQAQILSLPSILAVWALGWIGIALGERAGFAPLCTSDISNRRRILVPGLIGAAVGLCAVLIDRVQPLAGELQMAFPLSLVAYPLGGVIEEIVFRLFLTTLLVWLVSNVLLRGRWQTQVFWAVAAVVSGLYMVAQLGAYQSVGAITPPVVVRFLVVIGAYFLVAAHLYRRYGFLAAVSARWGEYLVWHIVWGYCQHPRA